MGIRILLAAVLVLFSTQIAGACTCANVPRFCDSEPDPANKRIAVFVGVVRDVFPSESPDGYQRALYPNLRSGAQPSLDETRDALLRVWRGALRPEEEQRLKQAKTWGDLTPFKDMFWLNPRRVRLDVTERFANAEGAAFEVFTGMGGGDCGVLFQKGESFLVVARQDAATGRWSTTNCTRTQPAKWAESDLAALRAWKKGERLKPMIDGGLEGTIEGDPRGFATKPLANVRLELRSASGAEAGKTTTDANGRFHFGNLAHEMYQIDVELPGWKYQGMSGGLRKVSLTKTSCAEVHLTMEQAGQTK